MLRKLCRGIVIVAAVAVVGAVRPAAAEPVSILGGTIVYSRQNQADFNLQLVGGSMQGIFGSGASESWDPPYICSPCAPGSLIDVSLSESMGQTGDVGVAGQLNFHGTDYFITNLNFSIESDPIRVPGANAFGGDETRAVMSSLAQFVLRGLVQSRTPNGFSGAGVGLLGYGKAQIMFLANGDWFQTTYTFEDPAAVPEPGTMLLFASGAAAAIVRRRRNRRAGSGVRDSITESV